MITVVFDTVVLVRSLINPYSWWGKIVFTHASKYRLFVSKPVLAELFEVLQRPELTRLFRAIEGLNKDKIIEIVSRAEVVDVPSIPLISRDVKDNIFLATAKAANADFLVSADRDLLDLKTYEGVKIIDAEAFLHILEKE